ncbi:tetratricopeptide repeat protein [Undibacterium sp. TJN25]|uniref:tetratricopeptide repeat protein n=1 Tax=Undibacterium sp. TJN25 TaxID=3413056 RepID=UPI003BF3F55C
MSNSEILVTNYALQSAIEHHQAGRLKEAEDLYKAILHADPNHAFALQAYGNLALYVGHFQVAQDLISQSLQIEAKNANALNNLGLALQGLRKTDDAMSCFQQAIAINENLAAAHLNAGLIDFERGEIERAIDRIEKALRIHPGSVEYLKALGKSYQALLESARAIAAFQSEPSINSDIGLVSECALGSALSHYLNNDRISAMKMLSKAAPLKQMTHPQYAHSLGYLLFLEKLLGDGENTEESSPRVATKRTLYVIGDSHSLSLHGNGVSIRGQEHVCSAIWIENIKQWDLGNAEQNHFKKTFDIAISRVPSGSKLVLAIGQIDCLLKNGVFSAWSKNRSKTLDQVICSTIENYLAYVERVCQKKYFQFVICGVPALTSSWLLPAGSDAEEFFSTVKIFNLRLKEYALLRGMNFLDTYAMTDSGNGLSNDFWHIDYVHLRTEAYTEAFTKHLY